MTAKMALRKKIHRIMSGSKIIDVMGFSDDEFTHYVMSLVTMGLIVCIANIMLSLQHGVDAATPIHRVLEGMIAELGPSAAETSFHDDHGAYEMSETAEISYYQHNITTTNVTSRSDESPEYSFIFPGRLSDAGYGPRRRPWYDVESCRITEVLRDFFETFETRINETTNVTSCSDGEYGSTKMYIGSLEEELALGSFDHSDKPQDVKFQKYSGSEIRTTQHDKESANRVQTGSTLESFGDGSEIMTGPSCQENWISRSKHRQFILICSIVNSAIMSLLILLVLRAGRRSKSRGIGYSSAWMDCCIKATHGFEPDQSTPVQGEMPDDAVDLMGPLLRDQIKIALEHVLGPVTAALLHQGREDRAQRQKLIAMEKQKLALKREKVRWLRRRRACRFQLIRRALATKLSGNKSAQRTDLPLQLHPPSC